MKIFAAVERFAAMDRSSVIFDQATCLHRRDRFSNCEDCFEICPASAITPGKPPALDMETCQSCLACLAACPVSAYQADDSVSSLLNCAARIEAYPVEVICGLHPDAEVGAADGIGLRVNGCLAGLGAGTYILLASLGLERLSAVTDACKGCSWAGLDKQVEMQIAQARLFLAAWGKSDIIVCRSSREGMTRRPLWNTKDPPLSRRGLFRLLARQGKIALARAIEKENVPAGRSPGRDRLRLLIAMGYLPTIDAGMHNLLGTLDFAILTVSEACDACAACARTCPTHALQFEISQDGSTYALDFSPRLCIGCDMCTHACAPEAITVQHNPDFTAVFEKEIIRLRSGELVKCPDCGDMTVKRGDKQVCRLCEHRREHPFPPL